MAATSPPTRNGWLITGGVLSAAASLLHLACIVGGPAWYRFFGAGEEIARAAERGSPVPALITTGIAAVLAGWAYWAFAGGGVVPRPPLLRTGLVAISGVYLLRGLMIVPALTVWPWEAFTVWSSAIVLGYGVVYAVGTWRGWLGLSGPGRRGRRAG